MGICTARGGKEGQITAKTWFIIYIVIALIFALIMVWIATSSGKKKDVNLHNGAEKLEIVEGYYKPPFTIDVASG